MATAMNYPRRQKGIDKVNRVLLVYRGNTASRYRSFYEKDGEAAKRMLRTRKPCSNWCCGNPRRWFGIKTNQERRADDEMASQLDDLTRARIDREIAYMFGYKPF